MRLNDTLLNHLWSHAEEMALAVNGGDWETDYTDAQKRGWFLKAAFMEERYQGIPNLLDHAKWYLQELN